MNIGFDLDRIFINRRPPYISEKIIETFYKQKNNGTLLYRIPSKMEQLLGLLSHHRPFRPPMKDNLLFMKELASKNTNKHYLISGRFGFLKKKTEMLIKKQGLDKLFDAMYFNYNNEQPHLFKDMLIKRLHIDRFVDDDLDLLKFLSEKNLQTKFFWLNNKKDGVIQTNLFAITNLKDIFS